MDLRRCVEQVQASLGRGDIAEAARCVGKYRTFDSAVLGDPSFIDAGQDPIAVFRKAEAELGQALDAKAAACTGDEAEALAVLYPLVGRSDEGVALLSGHLARQLDPAAGGGSGGDGEKHAVEAMTELIERFASVVAAKQPLIAEAFGQGGLAAVLVRMDRACAGRIEAVVDAFLAQRDVQPTVDQLLAVRPRRPPAGPPGRPHCRGRPGTTRSCSRPAPSR